MLATYLGARRAGFLFVGLAMRFGTVCLVIRVQRA